MYKQAKVLQTSEYTVNNGTKTFDINITPIPTLEQIAYIYNKTQNVLYYAPAEDLAKASIDASGVVTIEDTFDALSTGDILHIQLWDNSDQPIDKEDLYSSPNDFTAAFATNVTITVTGAPFTVDDANCRVVKIDYKPSGGTWKTIVNGRNGVSITASSGTLTIAGAGTPLASGDTYEVSIKYQKKAYDADQDVKKTQEQSPIYDRNTDAETLLSAAQDFTTSWVDCGNEVENIGYKTVTFWITLDINDTIEPQLQFLFKHESGGSEEYTQQAITVNGGNVYYENVVHHLGSADKLWAITIEVDNSIRYIQPQIKATTAGATAGQIDDLYVTKGY